MLAERRLQVSPPELACLVPGKAGNELVRHRYLGWHQAGTAVLVQHGRGDVHVITAYDHGACAFAQHIVWPADYRGVEDAVEFQQDMLDLCRIDVEAADIDDIRAAI